MTEGNVIRRILGESPRGWLGLLADLIGVGTAIAALCGFFLRGDWAAAILAVALALITMVSLLVTWRLELELRAQARLMAERASVGNGLSNVAAASAHVAQAVEAAAKGQRQHFVTQCDFACEHFAAALRQITGVTCRVTMQQTFVPVGGPTTEFLVKPIASSYPRGRRAERERANDNSDFTALIEGDQYFHSNDLVDDLKRGYRNSHWTPEKLRLWDANGEYPYRSTLVWPIRGRSEDEWVILGFLSADSRLSGTFNPDTIVAIGEVLTHAAYTGLVFLRAQTQEDN